MFLIDHQYLPFATALIESAKKEILISTFKLEITDKPRGRALFNFFNTLIKKRQAGVKIKILFNCHDDRRSTPKTNFSSSATLKKHGIDIRHLKDNRCCHAKTMIIDRQHAVIGSHNLSVMSCLSNFEISYIVEDLPSINALSTVFDHSFNAAKPI
ncbi:MAG: phospholipase D family protein [Candidatus Omnitrophica bacterium]|nr:phospholipase D family protein [Candidatus Omnitrophota bacterium]